MTASLGGRFGAPELRGDVRGAELSVRNVLQGVGVSDGELAVVAGRRRGARAAPVVQGGDGS